jgi:acetyl/propionyl-CoA carboxylase alpha subunit
MFKKVLIANRGIIQANCVRAVKELGARAITIFEEADKESAGVRNADEAYELVVKDRRHRAYLDIDQIVELAERLGVDAVHPGYGFLAQNAEFVSKLAERKIAFIAPSFSGVFNLSNKHLVKAYVAKTGMPILPGSECFKDKEWLYTFAEAIGYPLVIKSAYGYGGLGMRVVWSEAELLAAFEEIQFVCSRLMLASNEVFLEKYLEDTQHIEFPVFRDHNGQVIVLPELECCVQRRFKKLVVESPSPNLSPAMRQLLESQIRVLVDRLGIHGFASVEFLLKEGKAYFLEINGYIQPAHTASGLLTGIDMLKEQIRLVSGESLSVAPGKFNVHGHVINAYVCAEDPENGFVPSPGTVDRLYLPFGEGVFLQSSIFSGATISSYYDPMIAKLLVRGSNREDAMNKMIIALKEFFVEGVRTNIPLLRAIICSPEFKSGNFGPALLNQPSQLKRLMESLRTPDQQMIAAMIGALAVHRDTLRQSLVEAPRTEEEIQGLGAASRWIKNKTKTN